ncbi:hypothetical protein BCR34DRAFT_605552 [Clohesyomyces aquaticus]|uniref:CHCH domain-containing protein n=1 Tax=Clohesyomyces aquaticus TaxID=1231657 RepID=A0A1Y1YY02_9PLEO|nr:hypothetical protein BCR34DRAFT_605552 [Clohesyomyces aquaticus]
MARSRGGPAPNRSGPNPRAATRPAAPPARPAAPPSRPHSTAAAPPAQQPHAPQAQQAPPAQASQGPGLFGQMASTAAGVAVGSSIGHAIGGFFGGGSSSAPADNQSAQATEFSAQHQPAAADATAYSSSSAGPCANDVQTFRKCMDDNQGSLTICGWYLDQLKACQSAAGQY